MLYTDPNPSLKKKKETKKNQHWKTYELYHQIAPTTPATHACIVQQPL